MNTPQYFTPKSVAAAISLLSEYGEQAKLISGGTDLLLQMKRRVVLPDYLISIGDIPELDYIDYDETSGLRLGALTTMNSIKNSPLIQSKFSILAQAAGTLGTPTIRNQATIAGNLCNAAPSADTASVTLIVPPANISMAPPDDVEMPVNVPTDTPPT